MQEEAEAVQAFYLVVTAESERRDVFLVILKIKVR